MTPALNQIRWAPALHDHAVVRALRERGVTLEGYSPFKETRLDDPALTAIAEHHGVSTRQVVLRWHIEHGFIVIPKSADRNRIAANFDVFDFALEEDEVEQIDALGR